MQKKTKPQEQQVHQSSDWEKNLKREEQKEKGKKLATWGGIILASVLGLALLVWIGGRSGSTTTEPVVKENLPEVSVENDIIIGNPNAQVTIIEYADFQCPACADYNSVLNQVEKTYSDNVRVVYRIFPIDSIHKNAQISAQAAYAAWKLDKFSEMKDELYLNQSSWETLDDPTDEFIKYATSIGLDETQFTELMNSKEAEEYVNQERAEALSIGLNSTPTFFIARKQVSVRTFEDFKALIDAELGESSSSSESNNPQESKPTTIPLQ